MKEESSYDLTFKDNSVVIDPPKKKGKKSLAERAGLNLNDKAVNKLAGAIDTSVLGFNTGLGDSKYDEGLSWFADVNPQDIPGSINEYRSQEQGILPTAASGLGRVGSKVARELLKTAGAVVGTVGGIAGNVGDLITGEDNTDFLKTAFDNTFIRGVDTAFDNVNSEYLPVYVSDTVAKGDFFDKVSNSEFWATEGADGAGYLISAMAPGAVLKGLNAGGKLFGAATKLTALRYGKNLEVARRALTQAGMSANKIDGLIIPAANTFFEAGAESKGVSDDMDAKKPQFVANVLPLELEKLGALDLDKNSPEYFELEKIARENVEKQFQEQKGYAMRNTFLTNLAILAGPNYIQSKILYGNNGAKNLLNQVRKSPVKQGLRRVGEAFLSEGSEEVAQTSTEHRQVEKGLTSKLHGGLESFKDISPVEFGVDFIKTLGTTEGQVAGFLGGILGSPISVVGGYRQDKKDQVKSDNLRAKIETTGTSLNDIHLPTHKTKTSVNPETGEEIEEFELDENGQKIPIVENIVKIKNALDKHEELSKIYDDALEAGDTESIDSVKKIVEHDLIMNFINEDEMSLDALKEHLQATLPTNSENKQENNVNSKRQAELIEKAKYLQKELISFQDMSANIIKLENEKATPEQVKSFMGSLANEFLQESSKLYDLHNKLNTLQKAKVDVEKQTTIQEVDNPLYQEGVSSEFDKKVKTRVNPRLNLLNSKIDEVKEEIKEKESFLNYGVWNSKIVNGAFNQTLKEIETIQENTKPEVVKSIDDTLEDIKNSNSIEELELIDLKNNPVLRQYYDSRKKELEDLEREKKDTVVANEVIKTQQELDEEKSNLDTVKIIGNTNKVGDIVTNPFTQSLATVESTTKNSVTLKDAITGEISVYDFPIITDTVSADDIVVSEVTDTEKAGKDHVTPGRDNDNLSYANYLSKVEDKTGHTVTFELRNTNLSDEQKFLKEIVEKEDKDEILKYRQDIINKLAINFVYNNGEAKSWSSFNRGNAEAFREAIVNKLVQGHSFSSLYTKVTNQKTPSFNTEFNNGKPVKNNPLNIKYVQSLDKNNPENKVTLYHVNTSGDLILVTDNKEPLSTKTKSKLESQKGQIFLVIKNPKTENVPVKLNRSKIEPGKTTTLAKIYESILKRDLKRTDNLIVVKKTNLDLYNEILTNLASEIEVLGNNTNVDSLIEILVQEGSGTNELGEDTSIVVNEDNNGDLFIKHRDKIFDVTNIKEFENELQNKYQNVITITSSTNINPKLNFKNPEYIKYLFDNLVLSTNLNLENSFKVETTNGGKDFKTDTGSELFLSSTINSNENVDVIINSEITENNPLQEYDNKISEILSKIKEDSDSVTAPIYMINGKNELVPVGEGKYFQSEIVFKGKSLKYNEHRNVLKSIVEKNLEKIRNSENNYVPLQNNNVIMQDDVNIPGTKNNLDYQKAFENLEVKGEDITEKENLERLLRLAETALTEKKSLNPKVKERLEQNVLKYKQSLVDLAKKIKTSCK